MFKINYKVILSDKLNILRIISPKTTLDIINNTFVKPTVPKESLIKMVHIIKPVFLIIWVYFSVY